MKLQEASKSKRRMRRPCFPEGMWYTWAYIHQWQMLRSDSQYYTPDQTDAFADDWELEPESITIDEDVLRLELREFPLEIVWKTGYGHCLTGYYMSDPTVEALIRKLRGTQS